MTLTPPSWIFPNGTELLSERKIAQRTGSTGVEVYETFAAQRSPRLIGATTPTPLPKDIALATIAKGSLLAQYASPQGMVVGRAWELNDTGQWFMAGRLSSPRSFWKAIVEAVASWVLRDHDGTAVVPGDLVQDCTGTLYTVLKIGSAIRLKEHSRNQFPMLKGQDLVLKNSIRYIDPNGFRESFLNATGLCWRVSGRELRASVQHYLDLAWDKRVLGQTSPIKAWLYEGRAVLYSMSGNGLGPALKLTGYPERDREMPKSVDDLAKELIDATARDVAELRDEELKKDLAVISFLNDGPLPDADLALKHLKRAEERTYMMKKMMDDKGTSPVHEGSERNLSVTGYASFPDRKIAPGGSLTARQRKALRDQGLDVGKAIATGMLLSATNRVGETLLSMVKALFGNSPAVLEAISTPHGAEMAKAAMAFILYGAAENTSLPGGAAVSAAALLQMTRSSEELTDQFQGLVSDQFKELIKLGEQIMELQPKAALGEGSRGSLEELEELHELHKMASRA